MKEQKSEYNVFTSRVVHLSFKVQIIMECCYTPSFNFLNLPPNYLVPCSLCVRTVLMLLHFVNDLLLTRSSKIDPT